MKTTVTVTLFANERKFFRIGDYCRYQWVKEAFNLKKFIFFPKNASKLQIHALIQVGVLTMQTKEQNPPQNEWVPFPFGEGRRILDIRYDPVFKAVFTKDTARPLRRRYPTYFEGDFDFLFA